MSWWLLATLAFAGKKDRASDAGPEAAALAAAEEVACARDVPENYQIHTGFGADDDATEAIQAARLDAQRGALATLCSGKSEMRCAVLRRHLEDWKQPFHNPLTGKACAHVGVNRKWIDDDKREQEALSKALTELAQQVAERIDGPQVALQAPVWGTSGCDAGDLGVAVLSELRGALADGAKALVPVGTPGSAEVTVTARITEQRVFLDAAVRPWKSAGELPVKGVSFSADLFALDDSERTCWLDADLGLPGGHRDGPDALRVWVDTGMDRTVCEGDRGTPKVSVSRPSRVKVWSVDKTGSAYLVWPPPGEDGSVQSHIELGEMSYYVSPAGGEERLVAVAVPEGARFPTVDAWTGFCRHPGRFAVGAWSNTAATAAALAVHRFDAPACVQRGTVAAPPPPMPDVPVCPERLGG